MDPRATGHPPKPTLLQRLVNYGLPHTRFYKLLLEPRQADKELATLLKSRKKKDLECFKPQRVEPPTSNPDAAEGTLAEVWRSNGAWKWTRNLAIRGCRNILNISSPRNNPTTCKTFYGTGTIDDQDLEYVAKSWPRASRLPELVTEISLYKRMRDLGGVYIPGIIGLYTGVDRINMLMELPHPHFWVEASDDMPDVLKKRCITCFEMIHAAGVLHGAPYLHNIFIGGDARVIVTNFEQAKVIEATPALGQQEATPNQLRLEMRQIKYLLNYDNAREIEEQKWLLFKSRKECNEKELELRKSRLGEYWPHFIVQPADEILDPPVDPRKQKGWKIDKTYFPRRYVNPTISNETFASAVDKLIHEIDRLQTEGDSPPSSRPPSPAPPAIQHLPSPPSEPIDIPNIPDETAAPQPSPVRRSARKRAGEVDPSVEPASKRQKMSPQVERPPNPSKPIPRSEPVKLESFVQGSSKDCEPTPTEDTTRYPRVIVRDFAFEPVLGNPRLRSVLRPVPTTFVTPPPDDGPPIIIGPSRKARAKRKRSATDHEPLMDEALIDELASPRKRPRRDMAGGKHVSFAPAPEVRIKRWTIPSSMLTSASHKYRQEQFRRRRYKEPPPVCEPAFQPAVPLPFRFVSRWVKEMVQQIRS